METTILQLTEEECKKVIRLLNPLDPHLKQRVEHLVRTRKIHMQEALEILVTANPVLWARVYLDWEARDYQVPMLSEMRKSRSLVFRLGRRLGKTDSMCVGILWFAYTQYNKGPNPQYNIVIATPYETQVNLIFTRLKQIYDHSPLLLGCMTREIQHRIEFIVDGVTSIVEGFTAGASNASAGANNTRGQRADVVFLDEVDYIGPKQIANIFQLRNEAPERIKFICASTPTGKHEDYYRWCTGASKKYFPSEEDIKNNEFHGYLTKTVPGKEGNGWTEIYAPSNVNKEVLKINPETGQTYLQDMKDQYSQMVYAQEVMAEFGEENVGVYQKKFIEMAIQEGIRTNHQYITKWDAESRLEYLRATQGRNIRCLGVDWDKYGAATHMVCVEYDRFHQTDSGMIVPVFKVLFHEEIPRGEFTYTNAENKIIRLNDEYKFDWIAIDRGYGETQAEHLKQYGLMYPESHLGEKLVAYQFSENIEVTDPITRKKEKKPLKPFMVNNSVSVFEKGGIILDPKDKYLKEQLEQYRVISISQAGKPIYSSENEHALDAMNLALLVFAQHYDKLLQKVFSSHISVLSKPIDSRQTDVKPRSLVESIDDILPVGIVRDTGRRRSHSDVVASISPNRRSNYASQQAFRRKMW